MATAQRQSKLHRRVPAALLIALSVLAPWCEASAQATGTAANPASASTSTTASAALPASEPDALLSHYSPVTGAPFFLLADSGFTSNENARVRVEGDPQAFADYGGVDVLVYRVPKPLDFLKAQKDLHRIQVNGDYAGEGLSNTLSFLWDKWFKKSRMVYQQIFSSDARRTVVNVAPSLKQAPPGSYSTDFRANPQYRVLKQFNLLERFRYPVGSASPIAPPADTQLHGSSSEFIAPQAGDVYVPLGKLAPGLYLVEAYTGGHRATTLVFVSDTVAISKTAGKSMLVWTADRSTGKPVGDVEIVWSDGNGVLKSERTDTDGMASFERDVPEKAYTLGQDQAGGVFVSENFYYDSEVYNSKLYLFTDRPLYKPGDRVQLKIYGREFTGARASKAIEPAALAVQLVDPAGQVLLTRQMSLNAAQGGDTQLSLPANAYPGGYTLRFAYRGATYSAMFRVADYAKPAFDVTIRLDRDNLAVGDPVTGQIELHYADGAPVKDASIALDLKTQALSATNGDPEFGARFPQKLAQTTLHADPHGIARFSLPAAAIPSRYLLQAVAREHDIFPVSANRELILQPAPAAATLKADQTGLGAGKPIGFTLSGLPAANRSGAMTWQAIRLEDRSTLHGSLMAGQSQFSVNFPNSGSYNLFVHAGDGALLGQTSYSIAGPASHALAGAIAITVDKPRYQAGDVAHLRIVFPEPVDNALLTLERDQIEARSLLSRKDDWLTLSRRSPTEWQADIPVKDTYGPNITFSALYVKRGDFNFQNAGIQVVVPAVDIAIHTDRPDYRPGDKVTVDLTTQLGKQPVSSVLSASVVDDMVYTLQPEVAPSIFDFFYAPRRDSVRTTASLNFYGYDLAWSPQAGSEAKFDYNQRALKILTRPRRETIDTAAWRPTLTTDAQGHVSFSFIMPDSLSRWRITVRATTADGAVGQRTASITSSKPVYMQWSGPTRFRQGDAPKVGLLIFNHTRTAVTAQLKTVGLSAGLPRDLTLVPGDNFVALGFDANHDTHADLQLIADGQLLDRLSVPVSVAAPGWTSWQSQDLHPGDPVRLPADAGELRLVETTGSAQAFGSIVDSLIDYPYGCVEQTASQMIPLTMALDSLPADGPDQALRETLQQRLQTARGRLMAMAGPKADFAWWGDQTAGDPLLTTYAYYADRRATQRLGIELPPEHWQHVFDTYQAGVAQMPLLQRALTLWLMQDMHLPVRTLLQGLQTDLANRAEPPPDPTEPDPATSIVFSNAAPHRAWQMSLLLWRDLSQREHTRGDPALAAKADQASHDLQASSSPVLAALAAGLSTQVSAPQATALANRLDDNTPTMERALALIWLQSGVQHWAPDRTLRLEPGRGWTWRNTAGGGYWGWHGALDGNGEAALPATLGFVKTPPANTGLRLTYRSADAASTGLPVTLTRRLYRLTETAKPGIFNVSLVSTTKLANASSPAANAPGVAAVATVAAAATVSGTSSAASRASASGAPVVATPGVVADAARSLAANDLYVDEVTLTPSRPKQMLRYGILEIPVPNGAMIESQRFGFEIDGLNSLVKSTAPATTAADGASNSDSSGDAGSDSSSDSSSDDDGPVDENGKPLLSSSAVLSADRIQEFGDYYAVPVTQLSGPLVIRHLIRLGQAGRFVVPAARYYRMYQPSAKALETTGQTVWNVQ